jgi:3'-5' exoribonuclease
MKKTFIDQIKAGERVSDIFVLAEKSLSQKRDGSSYLNVTITDRTGSMKGVAWDLLDQVAGGVVAGDVVQVQGKVSEYKGSLQAVIKKMTPVAEAQIDPSDFMPATSHNIEVMFDRLVRKTEEMKTPCLKSLMDAFWRDKSLVAKFKRAPAAKRMHHAYIGGLLEHTLSMAILVERIAGHYSGIDMDLLLSGVVLHDFGKIHEFDYTLTIDYSDAGRLLSHIVIGIQLLEEKLKEVDNFPEETANLLKHLIISHHGVRDFGSPEPPKTLEAVLLNYIDEIDSKVRGIRDFMAAEDSDAAWTSYHRILGRHFYRGKRPHPDTPEPNRNTL